jgi:HAD superfamily hydrolase (TIGR01549 family)
MKTPTTVLFDLDGVLVRSEEPWFRTVEESGRRFRGRPVTREEFAPTFGQGTRADIEVFGLRCSVEELDRFYVEVFPRFASETWVDPEAAPLLDALGERGLKRAVVTNTVTPLARIVLESASLLSRLEVVACASEVAHPKPEPDLVIEALRRLGVGAGEAWMVGDSRYDREAARAAGVHFVGLGIDGDARIDALGQLLPLIDRARARG